MSSKVERTVAILLALVILVGITPIPVAAQTDGPNSVLLDSNSEVVATMDVEGSSYTVYQVNNTLPYAGGIEIYADGQRVTDPGEIEPVISRVAAQRTLGGVDTSVDPSTISSEAAAQEQFRRVAWQVAARDLSSSEIQQLREISATAERIDELVSRPLTAIDTVLTVFQTMKDTGLLGVSVWDVATSAHPSLTQLDTVLSALQTELQDWNDGAEQVSNNVRPAVQSLERAQQGEDVDYEEVSTQLQTAATGLEELNAESEEVESRLSTAGGMAGEAADVLSSSDVPGRFVQPIADLSGQLETSADEINAFRETLDESRSQLQSVDSTAESEQQAFVEEWKSERSSLRGQWKTRKSAGTRVYGTLGGGGVGTAGIALFARRWLLG
jgi:hypothetical protein